ncbi:unnamed protein product [Phytophthora fragariaefolia]|uniref:Unnamed protein product n=1 Tax=Phytophthora fragariaefolia TaxID=1490495 RepID=A0A9W6XVW4_9STRA|nr:unnamed protein product [Phytophthora fragariaefolia]
MSEEELHVEPDGPLVDHPLYETPLKILRRDTEDAKTIVAQVPMAPPDEAKLERRSELVGMASGSGRPTTGDSASEDAHEVRSDFEEAVPTLDTQSVAAQDDAMTATTDEVTIEDIEVGDPTENTPEEIERLRQIIWKRRHLLMGKGNALPPAAVGAVCDVDEGEAAPAAQRVRRVAPQFREKLSDLIKSLLSAKMITPSTSPWASPIVIIIKKKWRGYPALYRLQASEQSDAIDGVSHSDDQRSLGRLGQGALVLLTRYDQWLLGAEGLEAHPKDLEMLGNLPFPLTLRAMQSYLGSLNYYRRFIEDFAIYAAVLYELHEGDFQEIGRQEENNSSGRGTGGVVASTEQADRWTLAKFAFTMLKAKLVSTPILKHFDPDRTLVIIHYAI